MTMFSVIEAIESGTLDLQPYIEHCAVHNGVTPALIHRIRTKWSDSDASLIADLAAGTARARGLGKTRGSMIYTNVLAQQATPLAVSHYCSMRYAGQLEVIESCSGAGMDTISLALASKHVTTYETCPLTSRILLLNLRQSGISNVTVVNEEAPAGDSFVRNIHHAQGFWADPARRTKYGLRVKSATEYTPAVQDIVDALPTSVEMIGIKVGPADEVTVPDGWKQEFVGVGSECLVRVLWRHESLSKLTLTLTDPIEQWVPPENCGEPRQAIPAEGDYLIEPHNVVIAGGTVAAYHASQDHFIVDRRIAYGFSRSMPKTTTMFHRIWRIIRIRQGVSLRRIQQDISELSLSPDTVVKKRGWSEDPEVFRKRLRFTGTTPGTIFVIRTGKGHITAYCRQD